MSEENVETVRKLRDCFNAFMRGELSSEDLAQFIDPQVEYHWHDQRTYPDTPQHLRGVSAVIAFTEQFRAGWTDLAQEALELSEARDGRVLVFVRQTGRGHASGVPIEIHFFELCTIRDGKLRQVEYFRHRADGPYDDEAELDMTRMPAGGVYRAMASTSSSGAGSRRGTASRPSDST
jgi:ketosteroid isomerase-like protein